MITNVPSARALRDALLANSTVFSATVGKIFQDAALDEPVLPLIVFTVETVGNAGAGSAADGAPIRESTETWTIEYHTQQDPERVVDAIRGYWNNEGGSPGRITGAAEDAASRINAGIEFVSRRNGRGFDDQTNVVTLTFSVSRWHY